ncbi:hypothetical protein [Ferrithrix thermotolerans]|uniref:hypothetical protein n=1 Tax=Ferrithrix thermotolerans TaxID=209649 RepID=UPI0009331852|nr:hypothetical protein [Ferrithrix thermotolerans]
MSKAVYLLKEFYINRLCTARGGGTPLAADISAHNLGLEPLIRPRRSEPGATALTAKEVLKAELLQTMKDQ